SPVPKLEVPEPHGPIIADRGEAPAIRTKRHAADAAVVALEGDDFLPLRGSKGYGVPNADRMILAGRNESVAVAAEGNAADRVLVPAQSESLPAGRQVPKLHIPIVTC